MKADDRLQQTLRAIASVAADFRDDWWIIGSVAATLVGADAGAIRDVDVVTSDADARRLLDAPSAAGVLGPPSPAGGPNDLFRSRIFARFESGPPLPLEIMAGFEIREGGVWRPVRLATRRAVAGVFVPEIHEQIALLERMGRPKDAARIAALRAVC